MMKKQSQKKQLKKSLAEEILFGNSTDGTKRAFFSFDTTNSIEEIRVKYIHWARYFFPKFFSSPDAPEHKDIDIGNIKVYLGLETNFLDIAFRGFAKTTRTKLFIAFAIANDTGHFRKYFKVLSKELNNAKQTTTDVYNMLISKRVRALYPEIFQKTEAKREETMASFTTATGIKMTADTIGTDQRGDIQDESRPDFIFFDDIETRISLMSAQITFKIWQNIDEAITGLSKDGGAVYCCNYVSERGNVHKLVEKIAHKVIIPIERDGVPTWDRYTKEDIQRLKNDVEDFEGDYLCRPSANRDVYFDRESVDKQKPKAVLDEIAGLKIWKKWQSANRVGGGFDVGGGVGLDHSTSVFIDYDCIPAQVIATYKNNEIKPDAFAHEISRQAKRFGECYVAPEKNYGSTLDILKTIYPLEKIHRTQRNSEKIFFTKETEYGFETNSATKPTILADFSKAVEDGLIELNDPALIAECRSYTRGDLMDKEVDPRLTTRHFDLLMAACICWYIRNFVKAKKKDEVVIPRSIVSESRYEGNIPIYRNENEISEQDLAKW
jgi:hypothetical protein